MPNPFFFVERNGRKREFLINCSAHSASVVTYGQGCPLSLSGRFHRDPAIHADRIARVKKEIRKHALQLLSISRYLWDLIELGYQTGVECSI